MRDRNYDFIHEEDRPSPPTGAPNVPRQRHGHSGYAAFSALRFGPLIQLHGGFVKYCRLPTETSDAQKDLALVQEPEK